MQKNQRLFILGILLYKDRLSILVAVTTLDFTTQYNYLGLTMTEFTSYDTMASNVAKSASRALGLVIYKSKLNGGFPYECFS